MGFRKAHARVRRMAHSGFCLLGLFLLCVPTASLAAPQPVVTVGPDLDGHVLLGWDPVPVATRYEVRRFLDGFDATPTATPDPLNPTPTATPIAAFSAGDVLQFNDADVTNGRRYRYEVTTWDAGGPELPYVFRVVPFKYPSVLNNILVSTTYSNSVSVSWGNGATTFPIAAYEVYRYAWMPTPGVTPTLNLPAAPITVSDLMTFSPTPFAAVTVQYYVDASAATPGPMAYYYWVRAVDNGVDAQGAPQTHYGDFAFKTSNGVLPAPAKPAAPVLSLQAGPSLTPQVGSTGFGVRLSWNGPVSGEGIANYQILRNATPLTTVGVSASIPQTFDDTTADVSNLYSQSTTYSVVASNASGAVTSSSVSIALNRAQILGGLVATPNATTQAVSLTWGNAITGTYGLAAYEVFRSSNGIPSGTGTVSPTPSPIATFLANPSQTATPFYVDASVPNANGFSYWVAAVDGAAWLGPITTTQPATLRLAPTPPTSLTANGPVGNNRVQLSWNAGGPGFYGPVQAYRIYRMVPGGTLTPTPVATVSSALNQYWDVVTNASAQTPVVYFVSALDALGNSSDLTGVSNAVTLTSLVTPSAPSSVQATEDNQSLVFSWASAPTPDAVTGYRLFGSDWAQTQAPTPTPLAVMTAVPGGMAVTQSGLSLFQIVVNYLLADNPVGSSSPATLSGITVPTYQVTAVVPVSSHAVSISWNLTLPTPGASPGIDGYRIYRSLSPNSGYGAVTELSTAQNYFVDTTVPVGTTIYYIVTVKSGTLAESPLYFTQVPGPKGQVLTWPNVPSSVTALAGSTASTVVWSPNAVGENIVSYNLYHDGSASPFATVLPSPSPAFVCVETPGARSVYQVSAVNASGEGVECNAVSVLAAPAVMPTIGFTPPPGVTATPGLVWISNLSYTPDVAGYNVYRGYWATPSVTPNEMMVTSVSNPASAVSDAGVAGYTNYYRVVAKDAFGLEASHASSAYLSIGMAPGQPQSFTAFPSSSSVSLTWSAPTGDAPVTGYAMYRTDAMGDALTLLNASSNPTPQFVDTPTAPNSVYYYAVAARNAAGEGAATSETGVLFLSGPTVEITPNAAKNTLVWVPVVATATPPFSGYSVLRAQLPSTTFNSIGVVPAAASTPNRYVDNALAIGVTYVYQVAPSTSNGALGGSSVPLTQAALPQPVALSASAGDGFATLNWVYQGGGGTVYSVQRRLGTETDADFQTVAVNVTGSDYVDQGLIDKSLYVYRIVTVSSSGLTAISNDISVLPALAPVVRGNVKADPIEQGVSLSWPAANPDGLDAKTQYPLAGYRIYRSLDGGGTYRLVGSCTGTSYLDPVDVLSGDTRTYQVRAYDNPPDDPDMAHETTYSAVRVDSLSADTALDRNAIRPNGAAQERTVNIRFVVTQNGNVSMKVYSISGVFVKDLVQGSFSKGIHWTDWDATNRNGQRVASGVYLVTTTMPNRQEVAKVAVIK